MRTYGSSKTASIRSGSVMKYIDVYPLSKRIPSVNSSSMPKVFDSSTVMTPSLPTLSTASAILPTDLGVGRGDRANVRDVVLGIHFLGGVLDRLDGELDGLLDATLDGHRVGAGRHVAETLLHDRLREDRRRRGPVTGHVVGLLRDLLDELYPDLLERVLELDLPSRWTRRRS